MEGVRTGLSSTSLNLNGWTFGLDVRCALGSVDGSTGSKDCWLNGAALGCTIGKRIRLSEIVQASGRKQSLQIYKGSSTICWRSAHSAHHRERVSRMRARSVRARWLCARYSVSEIDGTADAQSAIPEIGMRDCRRLQKRYDVPALGSDRCVYGLVLREHQHHGEGCRRRPCRCRGR